MPCLFFILLIHYTTLNYDKETIVDHPRSMATFHPLHPISQKLMKKLTCQHSCHPHNTISFQIPTECIGPIAFIPLSSSTWKHLSSSQTNGFRPKEKQEPSITFPSVSTSMAHHLYVETSHILSKFYVSVENEHEPYIS